MERMTYHTSIESILLEVRRKWRWRALTWGCFLGLWLLSAAYLTGWTADLFGWFSWGAYAGWRWVLAACLLLPLVSACGWAWKRAPTTRQLALRLEAEFPELYDRLICAVEMSAPPSASLAKGGPPPSSSPSLVAAQHEDAGTFTSRLEAGRAVAPMPRWTGVSGWIVLMLAAWLTWLHPFFLQKMFSRPLTPSRLMKMLAVPGSPDITGFTLTLQFPEYTGLASVTQHDEGALHVPAGTVVEVALTFSGRSREGAVLFETGVPSVLDVKNGTAEGRFTVTDKNRYHFLLGSKPSAVYPISIIPDRPPDVKWLAPSHDHPVEADENIPVKGRATDDYGVSRMELVFRVNGGAPMVIPVPKEKQAKTRWEAAPILALGPLKLETHDTLACYFQAWDNHQPPQRAVSEVRFFEVKELGEDDKEEEKKPPSDQEQEDIADLIGWQRKIFREVWELERNRTEIITPFFKKVSQSREKEQRELTEKTKERMAEMAEEKIPFLRQGVQAMETASSKLHEGMTDGAIPPQQEAIAWLTKALRQKSKKSESQGKPPKKPEIKDTMQDREERDRKKQEEELNDMQDMAKQMEQLKREQEQLNQQAGQAPPAPEVPGAPRPAGQAPPGSPSSSSSKSPGEQAADAAAQAAQRAQDAVSRAQSALDAALEQPNQPRESESRDQALERANAALKKAEAHAERSKAEANKAAKEANEAGKAKTSAERALEAGVEAEREAARAMAEARQAGGEKISPDREAGKASKTAEARAKIERDQLSSKNPPQKTPDAGELAERQKRLEQHTKDFQERLADAGTEALPVGQELEQAASAMNRAASEYRRNDVSQGREEGQRAAEMLQRAQDALEQASADSQRRALEQLAERAEQLKDRQESLAKQTESQKLDPSSSQKMADAQGKLGGEAKQLGKALSRQTQSESQGEPSLTEEAADLAQQRLNPSMQEALKALKNQKKEEALKWQKRAAAQLGELLSKIQAALDARLGERESFSPRGIHISAEQAPAEHREAVKRYYERLAQHK